jgi:hypothetical protein
MFDAEPCPGLDAALAEAEIGIIEVGGIPALSAHDVVMVWPFGPFEAAPPLSPVDAVHDSLAF